MKIAIVNGPNLNLLGKREPSLYGLRTLAELENDLKQQFSQIELLFFQSNEEGKIVSYLNDLSDKSVEGVVINPGAYTHYSYAIRDAIQLLEIPVVEVHITNLYSREEFRKHSVTAGVCRGQISGFGIQSYTLGIYALLHYIEKGLPE